MAAMRGTRQRRQQGVRARRRRWVAAALVAAGVAGGFVVVLATAGLGSSAPTTTTVPPTTTTTAPPPIAPLTGLPDQTRQTPVRPTISAKIGNNPEARPQAGLAAADVVYEEEVEGRVTRFLAVFHSTPPEVFGPIRSVRLMDAYIAAPFGGVFVYSGGANVPARISRLEAVGLRHYDETRATGVGAVFIDRTHGNGVRPNVLFGRPGAFLAVAEGLAPPRPVFDFLSRGEAFGGSPVDRVTVPVGGPGFHPTWVWDGSEGVWRRGLGDEPFLDKSGEQVTATTLVVQFVERQGEESLVVGAGEAVVLAQGRSVSGRWVRTGPDEPARYLDAAGNPIRIPPGRTWVHLPRAGGELVAVTGGSPG